jgi:hypothetical protein
MMPWTEIGLWFAAFANIVLIGLQGRNLNTGNYLVGALVAIGVNNTQFLYIHAAVGYSHLAFSLIVGSASATGICASIWLSRHVIHRGHKFL